MSKLDHNGFKYFEYVKAKICLSIPFITKMKLKLY